MSGPGFEKIREYLSNMIGRNPFIQGVELVTVDGLPMASTLEDPDLEERIAALSAALSGVANRVVRELESGEKAQWVGVFGEKGGVISVEINPEIFMVVKFSSEAKLGSVLYEINRAKRALSELV